MYENLFVPRFDGGLNFYNHPAALENHEWTWANGFEPRNGSALQMGLTERITLGGDYLPASHEVVGIVTNLRAFTGPGVLVPTAHTASSIVRLWRIVGSTGAVDERTVSGTNVHGQSQPNVRPHMREIFFNGVQILHFGAVATGSNAVATFNGTNFSEIAPSGFDLTGVHIAVTANHIVLGKVYDGVNEFSTNVRWSDTGLHTQWNPAIDNTSGRVSLGSERGNITGMLPTQDGVVFLMDDRAILMRATGSVPPFSFQDLALRGNNRHQQWMVNGPFGTYVWTDGLLRTLNGAIVPGAQKCALYVENPDYGQPQTADRGDFLPIIYDTRRASCIIPTPTERFYFQPDTSAWYRKTWEAQIPVAHVCATPPPEGAGEYAQYNDYFYVTDTADVWREANVDTAAALNGVVGAFVDTKDFAFNEPTSNDYIDRIQVDWEPVAGAGDALRVYAYVREDLFPSNWVGNYGGVSDFTAQFVLQGTLAWNDRQLNVNLRGRYCRLRFESASGRARIRGFTIRRMRGSDRSD